MMTAPSYALIAGSELIIANGGKSVVAATSASAMRGTDLISSIAKGVTLGGFANTSSPMLRQIQTCITAAQERYHDEYIKRLYPDYAGVSGYPWFIVHELSAKDLTSIGIEAASATDNKPRIGKPKRNKARAKMARQSKRRNRG